VPLFEAVEGVGMADRVQESRLSCGEIGVAFSSLLYQIVGSRWGGGGGLRLEVDYQ